MAEGKLSRQLEEHTRVEEAKFEAIFGEIRLLRENHLSHIEGDLAAIQADFSNMKTDFGWVKWAVVLILGTLVTGSLGLIFK